MEYKRALMNNLTQSQQAQIFQTTVTETTSIFQNSSHNYTQDSLYTQESLHSSQEHIPTPAWEETPSMRSSNVDSFDHSPLSDSNQQSLAKVSSPLEPLDSIYQEMKYTLQVSLLPEKEGFVFKHVKFLIASKVT